MDGRDGYRRNGYPPGPPSGARPERPSGRMQPQPAAPRQDSNASDGNVTRAERFEDEKQRLTNSCFNKHDSAGNLSESYITHCRVQEDAAYPQTPPPPDSVESNKKPRIIVICVKNTGRVRIHKTRENPNGTFSIGKTWNMEDLGAIENYTSGTPTTNEERDRMQWAGPTGFTVTLIKPYFWQAASAKEKDFFLGSLVKIYRKYTSGKLPSVKGFSDRELDQVFGVLAPELKNGTMRSMPTMPASEATFVPSQASMSRSNPSEATTLASRSNLSEATTLVPRNISPEPPLRVPRQPPASSRSGTGSNDRSLERDRSPAASNRSAGQPYQPFPEQQRPPLMAQERFRQQQSREQMRAPVSSTTAAASLSSSQRLTPQSSRSEFNPQRSASPDVSSLSSKAGSLPSGESPRRPSGDQPSNENLRADRDRMANGLGIVSASTERFRPNGAANGYRRDASPGGPRPQTGQDDAPYQAPLALPERRRPPMLGAQANQRRPEQGLETPIQTPAPLASPRYKMASNQNDSQTSLDSRLETPPAMPGAFVPSPAPSEKVEKQGILPSPAPEPVSVAKSAAEEEAISPPVRSPSPVEEPSEPSRRGLGPMFKKKSNKDVAATLRRAATAYNAFQSRPGSAKSPTSPDEPDGITGVVPAPSLSRGQSNDSPVVSPIDESETKSLDMRQPTAKEPELKEQFAVKPAALEEVPEVTISSPTRGETEVEPMPPRESSADKPKPTDPEEEARRKQRRRSKQQAKYLSSLGIDAALLDGRGLEFESILSDFGWSNSDLHAKKIDAMEADIRREIGRVEAGSWLGHVDQKDDRVEAVEKLLDRAIAECDELEGLLTLYGVELSSLNEDIAFIEAQSQGLQVQTANQKLLQTELTNLVNTVSVLPKQLEPLKNASVGTKDGLVAVENSLLLLYNAMVKIDPSIRRGGDNNDDGGSNQLSVYQTGEVSTMQALREKKDNYLTESTMFLSRLGQYMGMTFGAAFLDAKEALDRQKSSRLDVSVQEVARRGLWQYSPLFLFAKEIDMSSWENLMKMYQAEARRFYQDALRDNAQGWKKMARKPTGDETDHLFTHQEKENEGLSTTARKLTVKRSQTLAKGLRSASGEKASRADKAQTGRLYPSESFANALDEVTPLIFAEQNFIVDLFHATSNSNTDFVDAVNAAPPQARRGPDLGSRRNYEPDRSMARRIAGLMDDLYNFWPGDLQALVDWALAFDPLQAIGIMCGLERKMLELEETNQDFLNHTLQKLHQRLIVKLTRFVDEQVHAIEDTKVKIKKRKGVIAFMRTFPYFSAAVENMLQSAGASDSSSSYASYQSERLEIRAIVNDAYQKINKSMFDSLKVIAKESPAIMAGAAGTGGQGDPEDKEALNYHILLIENMNHYLEEVDAGAGGVLLEWKGKAKEEMQEHMGLYVDAVIRRPLGKVLDFVDTTHAYLSSLPPSLTPTSLAQKPTHRPPIFRKLLQNNDSKELKRGVEALKKRVEKHFRDADDANLSRDLVAKVTKTCEDAYRKVTDDVEGIRRGVYEGEMEAWWTASDVAAAFR
ncbi:hypothetical protein K402DRAFT_443466 [Aulographum hederae CBS 113979]|uniref:Exocyst complex component Sec3 PIP2-binding N-terminal domain-containing protein n=1 Tax=Aulographum hederae CBS 113979 TaxID=1176131 RepID=A0A6G1HG84_9PEZI|nr:hypothetical protein K402DRAFT_443466 [Aulographum hederae CBS 113979]